MSVLNQVRLGCSAYKQNSGNVCFNTSRSCLLVDNLGKEFDLYNYPHTSPSDSFVIPRERVFVQQAIFLEDETTITCGSDHGTIYIFLVGTAKCLQKIGHGSRKTLILVLNICFILLFTAKIFYSYYRAVRQAINTYLHLVQMKSSPKFIYGKRYRTRYYVIQI